MIILRSLKRDGMPSAARWATLLPFTRIISSINTLFKTWHDGKAQHSGGEGVVFRA
jgi:hypothetical protein